MPISRRQIVGALKARGWQVRPDALKQMEAHLQHNDTMVDERVLDGIALFMKASSSKTLTIDVWEQYLNYEREQYALFKEQRAVLNVDAQQTPVEKNTNAPLPADDESDASVENSVDQHLVRTETSKMVRVGNSDWKVISAFRDVRLSYHTMKKQFQAEEQPWPLFGKAEDKVRHLAFSVVGSFILPCA
jgi:hypothetical protein